MTLPPARIAIVSMTETRRRRLGRLLANVDGICVVGSWPTVEEVPVAAARVEAVLMDCPAELRARERPRLSARESQVLALLVEGCRDKELAIRMGTSESTARTYVRRALQKIGVSSRTQAVAIWLQRGNGLPLGSG